MKRMLLGFLLALTVASFFAAAQQQPRIVRVGVAADEESIRAAVPPNSTPNTRIQRDLLVSYLNGHKSEKKSLVKVEAIALTTLDPKGILTEAREKGCDYVVELSLGMFNPFPESVSETRWNYSVTPQREAPASISYSIRKASDGSQGADSGFAWAPGSQGAMSVMSGVYDAIVKAATP